MATERIDVTVLCRLLDGWADEPGHLPDRLADAIAALVAGDHLADGTVLPPQRELATALGVARGTVTAAYELLAARDCVQARQGSGSRIRRRGVLAAKGPTTGRLSSFLHGRAGTIDLSSGALPGLPTVVDAFTRIDAAELAEQVAADGYHPAGLPRLREAIAARHTVDGLPTAAEQILVTSGSQQALWLVAHTLISAGDEVLVEDPTYRGALEAFRDAGATLLTVPRTADGLDPAAVDALLRTRRPRAVYLQPAAHNPTGSSLGSAARAALAGVLERHGALVIEDTSSADLVLDDDGFRPPVAARLDPARVLTIGTTSKLMWGGLRVGWVRAEPATRQTLTHMRTTIDIGTPVADQLVAADLIARTGELRRQRTVELGTALSRTERVLAELRPDWRWDRPSGGTSLWIDLGGGDGVTLVEQARRRGVRLVAGPSFSAFEGHRSWLKLPFWHPVELLSEALDRIDRR